MFEKEAEDNKPPYAYCTLDTKCELWKDGFQKGAEFGYKKGQSDQLVHKQYQLNQLRKANEWHFVKNGDLPINKNDGTTYLLYTIYGEGGSPVVAHFRGRDKQELMNIWTGAILTEDKIVAWKEIVLPTEIKEND